MCSKLDYNVLLLFLILEILFRAKYILEVVVAMGVVIIAFNQETMVVKNNALQHIMTIIG
jgi:hypothetical protein